MRAELKPPRGHVHLPPCDSAAAGPGCGGAFSCDYGPSGACIFDG